MIKISISNGFYKCLQKNAVDTDGFWKFVLELWICPELNIQEPRLCAAPFLIGEGWEVVCVGVDIQFSNQLVLEQATVTTIPGRPDL